jgi:hypothetical protein
MPLLIFERRLGFMPEEVPDGLRMSHKGLKLLKPTLCLYGFSGVHKVQSPQGLYMCGMLFVLLVYTWMLVLLLY